MELDKTALFSLSYGVYAVGSVLDGKLNAQIVNALFQVSAEPPLLAVAVNKNNLSHEFIKTSGLFSVSVLEQKTPMEFIGILGFRSGRDTDKFRNAKYKKGESGAPLFLEHTLAHIECRVTGVADAGTHDVFMGEVIAAANVQKGEPMTYAYYHGVKRGTAPPAAPVPGANVPKEGGGRINPVPQGEKMQRYVCTVCNYVYDPAKGDPDSGIEPGTPFSDIPDDWVCPVCGVGKDSFTETD